MGVHNISTMTNTDVLDLKTTISFAGLLPVENIYETEKNLCSENNLCIMNLDFLMCAKQRKQSEVFSIPIVQSLIVLEGTNC